MVERLIAGGDGGLTSLEHTVDVLLPTQRQITAAALRQHRNPFFDFPGDRFHPGGWGNGRASAAVRRARAVVPSALASRAGGAADFIKCASRFGLVAACPLDHADQPKRRLKMMKSNRLNKSRTLGGALALGSLLVAGLGLGAPSFAQEPAKSEKKIIAKKVDKDGKVTVLEGADAANLVRNCPEASKLTSDVTAGDDKQKHRTRVTICSKDGKVPTPEMREKLAAALEKAMSETGGLTGLSPERRGEALQALQREMDRVRSEAKD